MESLPHPLDVEVNKLEDHRGDPLPTFHPAQIQGRPYTLAVAVGAFSNYISFELAGLVKSTVRRHPQPYFIEGGHFIYSQCRFPIRVGPYEEELLCDVVSIKSVGVILGQEWITRMGVRYDRRRKTFIYPWIKKASP